MAIQVAKKWAKNVTEVLEYQLVELYVKQYKRNKFGKPVLIGDLPIWLIEKAMAGEGVLAQIVIDQFIH